MTLTPFRGRCHTCGHDHDAEDTLLRDVLDIVAQAPRTVTLPPMPDRQVLCRVMPDDYRYGNVYGFTADQMRDYAIAALREAGVEVSKT